MGQSLARLADLPDPDVEHISRKRSHHKRQSRHEFRSEHDDARRIRRSSRSRERRGKGPSDRRLDLSEPDSNYRKAKSEPPKARNQRRRTKDDWRDKYPSQPRRTRRPGDTGENQNYSLRTRQFEAKPARRTDRQRNAIPKEPIIHIEELTIEDVTPRRDCLVCVESRSLRSFPKRPPTEACQHDINTCKRCLRQWIKSEFGAKMWDQMSCPECGIRMQYDDMKEFAPSDVFKRWVSRDATIALITMKR